MQALLAEHSWDHAVRRRRCRSSSLPNWVTQARSWCWMRPRAEEGPDDGGVARQHAGSLGQRENCQTVVNCPYVTPCGHALYDFRLCLPTSWCVDGKRREQARVPADVEFTTKTSWACR
jgi:SRSO17 transposase